MSTYLDTFNILDQSNPFDQYEQSQAASAVQNDDWVPQDMTAFMESYQKMLHEPRFIPNSGGYLSPFNGAGWGATHQVMETLSDQFQLGEPKIDPNRIFSSDIAGMKTLAADQMKMVNMFKKKFVEGLTDKGKFGLNEDDIEAMQALTSAISGILAIKKEEAAIKAKITDIRVKQQATAMGVSSEGGTTRSASPYDVGKGFMDSIFDVPRPQQTSVPVEAAYSDADLDNAAALLENVVSSGDVSPTIQYESDNPTTYVVVGDTDTDPQFKTFTASGEEIADYPKPTSRITDIDRSAGTATDDLMVSYPLKVE